VKIHEKKTRKKFVKDAIKDFWNSNATIQFEILNKIEGIEGRNARCKRIPRTMFMEEGIQVQLLVESYRRNKNFLKVVRNQMITRTPLFQIGHPRCEN
jgi:hypothetical protein